MSQASRLFARCQAAHAAQFPAVITIGSQSYDCSTSGIKQQSEFELGGRIDKARVSFWLAASAFADAGQSEPVAKVTRVIWQSVAYLLDFIGRDPSGSTIILQCIGAEE